MSEGFVYLNGRLVPASEARVSVFDYGLLYGLSLYETVRAYQGMPFRLANHLARLERGAGRLGIPFPPEGLDLAGAIHMTLTANGLSDARVRITLTAGEGRGAPSSPPDGPPNLFISAAPLAPPTEEEYERGHKAIISAIRRSSLSVASRLKTGDLVENMLARREATEKGADQAILLNEKRCVAECAAANIFFVGYGRIQTPSLDCGLLPGVTRDALIGLALGRNMPVDERWVHGEEIWDAEEVFVTSATLGVFPVTSINGRPIRGATPGKVTRALTMAYRDLVKEELGLR